MIDAGDAACQEFQGRVALVTGGSRGIGRACVERLAAGGAHVAVNYRENLNAAAETVEYVCESGGRAFAIQADVTDETQVRNMIDRIETELGPVDLLVNNAGIFPFVSHEDTTLEIWNATLACNLTGVFLTTWAVNDGMIAATPLRRIGRPDDISEVVRFLLSEDSRFMTGQTIVASGGRVMLP